MIRFLNILSFLCRKISFFIGKDVGGVYAECDVTQKGSREQTWQSVMVRGKVSQKKQF